jgi:hypothetical protein
LDGVPELRHLPSFGIGSSYPGAAVFRRWPGIMDGGPGDVRSAH